MKATATVPVRIGAAPVALGAKNLRTGKVEAGGDGVRLSILAAAAGDIIEVAPGLYKPFAVNAPRTITIRSMVPGQRFTLDAAGKQWKLFEVLPNASLTLEDAVLTGNKMPYAHDAGVHTHLGTYDLILRRCHLHWLNNGILAGQHPNGTVLLEDCEINDCGDDSGQRHNLYIGTVKLFTMRRCWSHMVRMWGDGIATLGWHVSYGHLVKSRARRTVIEDCRLTMGTGAANRCVDLPNGGDVEIRRSWLEYITYQNKGEGQMISFGVEEPSDYPVNPFAANHPLHRLVVEDCVLANRAKPTATTLVARTTIPTPENYIWRNNIFTGPNPASLFLGTDPAKWAIPMTPASGNRVLPLSAFVDAANSDYRQAA